MDFQWFLNVLICFNGSFIGCFMVLPNSALFRAMKTTNPCSISKAHVLPKLFPHLADAQQAECTTVAHSQTSELQRKPSPFSLLSFPHALSKWPSESEVPAFGVQPTVGGLLIPVAFLGKICGSRFRLRARQRLTFKMASLESAWGEQSESKSAKVTTRTPQEGASCFLQKTNPKGCILLGVVFTAGIVSES